MDVRKLAGSAAVAAACVLMASGDANAARFDGPWNMVAETTRGHCGVIQISLGVQHGRIFSTGGSFAFYPINVNGRVSSGGQARMTAIAGPRIARGTGRFRSGRGEGTWQGRGPSGLCSGVWTASRA